MSQDIPERIRNTVGLAISDTAKSQLPFPMTSINENGAAIIQSCDWG